ncbi:MAG TPA: murein biosynthesis integral membrane protein MurJ [Xanthobacteraceae bacterium]|nr:murein biosynthesis integral membrane protein MurJ [Xanthobacteraceae bacterium]
MIDRILTVGAYTLASRVTGFLRDVVMAAVLGAGPVADAFLVAFRLPNHFRAIFAEGAFSAAFVPAYARIRTQGGPEPARQFADRIFTLLLVTQLGLLALALAFTPAVIRVLAPGFESDPGRFALATALTRVTFPYLLAMTLVALYGGMLNALDRFAAAAAAPILLNLTMVAALALAALFPSAGHAAAWGVLIAGGLEVALLAGSTARADVLPKFRRLAWDADVRRFFVALGPAAIGSGGIQLALFADTIIASFLPAGAISALYYADRLNQLPIGVIGIAVGTVLLPEMSRRIAAGDEDGARQAQSRAIEFTLLLSLPCLAAFLVVPDLILRALFTRGAFTAADAAAAGATLAAYALGLVPFVLIRSVVATFFARGDTATPVKAALIAVPVNIAFKLLLMGPFAQVGLALATTIGAWINFGLVLWFGARRGYIRRDPDLARAVVKLAAAGLALALMLWLAQRPALALFAGWGGARDLLALAALVAVGAAVYVGIVLALFGRQWLEQLRRRRAAADRPIE